jgi:hypothetical protein
MAEYLKSKAKCFIMAAALCSSLPGAADVLNDPTRPPASALSSAGGQVQPAGPTLQAVSVSSRRKSATISGQEVLLGEMYGEARLIAIKESAVTLRNADGSTETLQMYPGVEKKLVQPKQTGSAVRGQQKTR